MAETKTYTGGCHCGANKFSIPLADLTASETKLSSCNCSICSRNGYIWARVPKPDEDMTWTAGGPSKLTDYTFNTRQTHHFFCPTCGTSVFAQDERYGMVLNVRTIDDVDLEKLHMGPVFDGKSLE